MNNFWDYNAWGALNLISILLLSLLATNLIKKFVKPLQNSLIPASVLGGGILLATAGIYRLCTGNAMFDEPFFGGNGSATLELITYHTLALGFIASAFKSSSGKLTKKRSIEIFNTGVTTVSTYLLQGTVGMGITIIAALILTDFFPAAGLLLPFGYGQGTGQALNYGNIYEMEFGFNGGKSFGLTIAALGFLSASIGGVVHLYVLKKQGKICMEKIKQTRMLLEEIENEREIPMQGSVDKMTIQIAFVTLAYMLSYLLMNALGSILPGMKSVIFGFNFLLGVLVATLMRTFLNQANKHGIFRRQQTNDFLMTRVSNFFFDIMVVAGIAAIRLDTLEKYWGLLLIIGIAGLAVTYIYLRHICKIFFAEYEEEQFLAMYGMLTGTASTGVILLREIDGHFETPAADNMVYQNFPAIVFGFPLMILATLAPKKPGLTLLILFLFFLVLNAILFREQLLKKIKK